MVYVYVDGYNERQHNGCRQWGFADSAEERDEGEAAAAESP